MREALVIYFLAVSIFAVALTFYDKFASKGKSIRIRENVLLAVGFIGGATTMYLSMLLIRHKTKHFKFMFFLPLMIAVHVFTVYFLIKENMI